MAYSLPNFNLDLVISVQPQTSPNNVSTWYGPYDCQKYILSRQQPGVTAFTWWWGQLTPIFRVNLTQMAVDFGLDYAGWGLAYLECPVGSFHYYRIFSWEIMHQGFPNEYAAISAEMCDPDGFPVQPNSATTAGWLSPPLLPNLGPNP